MLTETKSAKSFCLLLFCSCRNIISSMTLFQSQKRYFLLNLAEIFCWPVQRISKSLNLEHIISSQKISMVKTFYLLQVFQKLLDAQLRELTKSLQNFLQGQHVSGNFVTKLPHYFQVCCEVRLIYRYCTCEIHLIHRYCTCE